MLIWRITVTATVYNPNKIKLLIMSIYFHLWLDNKYKEMNLVIVLYFKHNNFNMS